MIKTIILDLGNVLVFIRGVNAGLDIPKCNFLKKYIIRSKINQYERGKLSTEEFYGWFAKKTGQDIDVKNLDKIFENFFSLNEKMVPLLKKLKNNYRLVALSNTNEANYEFIKKKYGILDIFDENVLSYEAGYIKPHRRIYEIALEKSLCEPEECIFIDDNKKFIRAAKKLGINTIHYDHRSHSCLEEKLEKYFRIVL